jgi:tetratricopeptide (TPR) repeat protein
MLPPAERGPQGEGGPEPTLRAAQAAFDAGNFLEALTICRAVLEQRPGDVDAMTLMAGLCAMAGDNVAAIGFLRAALRVAPEHPQARRALTRSLRDFDSAAARATYLGVVNRDPTFAFHDNQEIMLSGSEILGEAIESLGRAIAEDPSLAEAHAALGNALMRARDFPAALASYGRAVHLVPAYAEAHLGIWRRATYLGEERLANEHLARALAIRRVFTEEADPQSKRRAVLAVYGAEDLLSNVPTDYLLHPGVNTVHKLYLTADVPVPLPESLPPFDLVWNAIGDSPFLEPLLDSVQHFIALARKPFVNDPVRIPMTNRLALVQGLADVPECRVPRTVAVSAAALAQTPLETLAAQNGIGVPLLIRPPGTHSGQYLARLERDAALREYLAATPAEVFYLSEFVDYRSDDGYYRKYRVILVDGRPYPYHLAISDDWLIHYFSAPMREHEWMRAEEEQFLATFEPFDDGTLAALETIGRRTGLDYFGVDCGLMPDGELLVFEVDAASLVHLGDPYDLFPYKHKYVPRILNAVERMLLERTLPPEALQPPAG